jgi:hypothetical protein
MNNWYLTTIKDEQGNAIEMFSTGARNLRLALEVANVRLCRLDAGHGQTATEATTERLDPATTRVYFRVPNFTGYGPDFPTFAEALAHAKEQFSSEYVRMFVECRVVEEYLDGSGGCDKVAVKIEVPNPLA